MAGFNHHVIYSAFFITFSIMVGRIQSSSHTEYEEMGIYPQRDHSLTKPYQGKIVFVVVLEKKIH